MALNNQVLDLDVQYQIYIIRAIEEEPRIWHRNYETRNKTAYFKVIARNINLEFHTNQFSDGKYSNNKV